MRAFERLWLRLFYRRRPRLPRLEPRVFANLSAEQVAWVRAITPLLDERYYLHSHPEVRHSGLSAAAHYVTDGHRKGFDPAPWFSDAGYVETHEDVRDSPIPPFVHYVFYGRYEGRVVTPTSDVRWPPPDLPAVPAHTPRGDL